MLSTNLMMNGENFELEVFINGVRAAWTGGTRDGDCLHLADIHVKEHGPRLWPKLPWSIRPRSAACRRTYLQLPGRALAEVLGVAVEP